MASATPFMKTQLDRTSAIGPPDFVSDNGLAVGTLKLSPL